MSILYNNGLIRDIRYAMRKLSKSVTLLYVQQHAAWTAYCISFYSIKNVACIGECITLILVF